MHASDIIRRHKHIILFDGVCPLCCGWVQFVYRRDRHMAFSFASVQSATGQTLLQWCGLPTTRYDTMVYIRHGRAHLQSDAFLHIVRLLRWPWPVLGSAWLIPPLLRNSAYNVIARNRYRLFGKRSRCFVPTGDWCGRFI